MKHLRSAAILTATVALTAGAVAGTAHANGPQKPKIASVTGSAEIYRTYHQDDDIRKFTFDAKAAPYTRPIIDPDTGKQVLPGSPNDATGTVEVSHYSHELKVTFTAVGKVESMVTAPGYATLTAVVIKESCTPAVDVTGKPCQAPDSVGETRGFSVYDGGKNHDGRSRDRLGYAWEFMNLVKDANGYWNESEVTGTSMAPAPFAPVTKGGFTVVHADLLPIPGT